MNSKYQQIRTRIIELKYTAVHCQKLQGKVNRMIQNNTTPETAERSSQFATLDLQPPFNPTNQPSFTLG